MIKAIYVSRTAAEFRDYARLLFGDEVGICDRWSEDFAPVLISERHMLRSLRKILPSNMLNIGYWISITWLTGF